MRWTIIAVTLLLAGCDFQREASFNKCISLCSGPTCMKDCGEAVHRAFSECAKP